MENSKSLWVGLGAVVVVVALVFLVMSGRNSAPVQVADENLDESVLSTEDLSEGSVNVNAPAPTAPLSYQEAIAKYGDARLQLDRACQASPSRMTFKNNTNIMIDNRASVSRTVKVGSVFTVKAYG